MFSAFRLSHLYMLQVSINQPWEHLLRTVDLLWHIV